MEKRDVPQKRLAPLDMSPAEFRKVGFQLVEQIADFPGTLSDRPVTPHESPVIVREALGTGSLPEDGMEAGPLLEDAAHLLFDHSLFNGHPRFMGMITSSAAPIGALGDLLAAAVNPNVGSWGLAPVATEIEAQTIRWIAEMIGYPTDCGGLLVSGGNMGNFVGLLTARKAKTTWDIRATGLAGGDGDKLCLYASKEAHTWIHKAADLFGLGLNAALLRDAFSSHHPAYYHFEDAGEHTVDYYEYGLQNSRGFRALKIWLALRQVGREGYVRMLADDITLAQELYRLIDAQAELQACTQNLSNTTFRYVPPDLNLESDEAKTYLNQLNAEILTRIQKSGEAFISNAVIRETFVLRACIVNFRTTLEDIEALPGIVIRIGREVDFRPAQQKQERIIP